MLARLARRLQAHYILIILSICNEAGKSLRIRLAHKQVVIDNHRLSIGTDYPSLRQSVYLNEDPLDRSVNHQ